MSNKHPDLANALLDELQRRMGELDDLMKQLMAEMDRVKYSGSPGQSEDFRRKFLDIRNQQRLLAEKFLHVTAALDQPSPTTKQ